jgi:hypothetical protein
MDPPEIHAGEPSEYLRELKDALTDINRIARERILEAKRRQESQRSEEVREHPFTIGCKVLCKDSERTGDIFTGPWIVKEIDGSKFSLAKKHGSQPIVRQVNMERLALLPDRTVPLPPKRDDETNRRYHGERNGRKQGRSDTFTIQERRKLAEGLARTVKEEQVTGHDIQTIDSILESFRFSCLPPPDHEPHSNFSPKSHKDNFPVELNTVLLHTPYRTCLNPVAGTRNLFSKLPARDAEKDQRVHQKKVKEERWPTMDEKPEPDGTDEKDQRPTGEINSQTPEQRDRQAQNERGEQSSPFIRDAARRMQQGTLPSYQTPVQRPRDNYF